MIFECVCKLRWLLHAPAIFDPLEKHKALLLLLLLSDEIVRWFFTILPRLVFNGVVLVVIHQLFANYCFREMGIRSMPHCLLRKFKDHGWIVAIGRRLVAAGGRWRAFAHSESRSFLVVPVGGSFGVVRVTLSTF
jgi:hypothetical protein